TSWSLLLEGQDQQISHQRELQVYLPEIGLGAGNVAPGSVICIGGHALEKVATAQALEPGQHVGHRHAQPSAPFNGHPGEAITLRGYGLPLLLKLEMGSALFHAAKITF